MTDSDGNYLFVKEGDEIDQSDFWDDSDLLEDYERTFAVLEARLNGNPKRTNSQKKSSHHMGWAVGQSCVTTWLEDGQLYDAEIVEIDARRGRCRVRFSYYGNESEVDTVSLLPRTTQADQQDTSRRRPGNRYPVLTHLPPDPPPPFPRPQSRKRTTIPSSFRQQEQRISQEIQSILNKTNHNCARPPPFIPRPRLQRSLVEAKAEDDDSPDPEGLQQMLTSWFLCGYNTGYYQGLFDKSTDQPISQPTFPN